MQVRGVSLRVRVRVRIRVRVRVRQAEAGPPKGVDSRKGVDGP